MDNTDVVWRITPNGTKYKIMKKEKSKFMKFLGFLLKPINPTFMTGYVTTIGKTIYAPGGTVIDATLLHEEKHIEDSVKYPVIYELSYLLCLPAVFTVRSIWEKRAYAISIKETYKSSPPRVYSEFYKENIINQFTSSQYGWMCPFRKHMEKWYEGIVKECENARSS